MKGEMLNLYGWDIDFEINREAYQKLVIDDIYTSKDKCVGGGIYLVDGRNMNVACWNGRNFDFTRSKFGETFPAIEFHWDDGPPYGTCKPYILIGLIHDS